MNDIDEAYTWYNRTFNIEKYLAGEKFTKKEYEEAKKIVIELDAPAYAGRIKTLKNKSIQNIILRVTQEFGKQQYGFTLDENGILGILHGALNKEKVYFDQKFLRRADGNPEGFTWIGDWANTMFGNQLIQGYIYRRAKPGHMLDKTNPIYVFGLIRLSPDITDTLGSMIRKGFEEE